MDADGNGNADPYNSVDAVFATARYLRANGAPGNYRRAIYAYDHADWYVKQVLSTARRFRVGAKIGVPLAARELPRIQTP